MEREGKVVSGPGEHLMTSRGKASSFLIEFLRKGRGAAVDAVREATVGFN